MSSPTKSNHRPYRALPGGPAKIPGRASRTANEPRNIEKAMLPNGIRILTERMTHVRSVSVGIWVATGSRRETISENGISHFIEHMVFKGTAKRTAEDIAKSIDSIGGGLDAFTSKEMVSFNTKVLDEHLPIAFDMLADLVQNPKFDPEDIKREKQVVLEEIKMESDAPDYLIHEILCRNYYKGQSIGRSILGRPANLRSFTRDTITDYFQRVYEPRNIIITAAGNLHHDQFVNLASDYFQSAKRGPGAPKQEKPVSHAPVIMKDKPSLEQVQVYLAAPCYPLTHKDRFACYVLNAITGAGISSRLFQSIRERQGLCYAVSSELIMYRDTGMFAVYAATSPQTAQKLVRSVSEELGKLQESPVPADELRRAQDHIKGSFMLGLESTTSRMSNLARQEMFYGRHVSMDEMLEEIETVTAAKVQKLAQEFFDPKRTAIAMLGPLSGVKVSRADLNR